MQNISVGQQLIVSEIPTASEENSPVIGSD